MDLPSSSSPHLKSRSRSDESDARVWRDQLLSAGHAWMVVEEELEDVLVVICSFL